MDHQHDGPVRNNRAFSLLEILFVLLIIGFLAAGSLKRWDALVEEYGRMVVYAGTAELNAREKFVWAKAVISEKGWQSDDTLFLRLDTNLGKDYVWLEKGPSIDGGRFAFQDRFRYTLVRFPSTAENPGRWQNHEP